MQRYKLHEVLVTNGDGAPLFQTESASTPQNTVGPLRNDAPSGNPNDSLSSNSTIPQPSNTVKPAEPTAKPFPCNANSQTFGNLDEPTAKLFPTGMENGDGLGVADAGSVNTDYDRLQAESDTFHPSGPSPVRHTDIRKRKPTASVFL